MASTSSMMPPEPPAPNLGSPRVRAAMRVLGILPQELEKKDPATMEGGQGRYQLLEGKRRNLVQSVNSLASKSPDSHGKKGDQSTSSMNNAAFMEDVLKAERATMERMQKMAQKDVQKIVISELEAKLTWTQGQAKQQESFNRMKALKKERDDKLKALQKEAQKKADKSHEVRERYNRQLDEHAESITTQLNEANERAGAKIAAIAAGHGEQKVKNHEKMIQIAERQEQKELEKVQGREATYEAICAKHEAKMEKLEELRGMRQSNAESMARREQECRDRVHQTLQKRQELIETKYQEISERHKNAGSHRKEVGDAAQKEFRVKNNKARSTFENRYERLKSELENHPNISRRLIKMQSMSSSDGMLFSCSEAKLAAIRECSEKQGHHTHLVKDNRHRLSRARVHAVDQQLNKIDMMRQRTQVMLESKANADTRRMATLRDCAIEKMHFQDQVQRVRDAGPDKMLKLLEDIKTDAESGKRINEILTQLGLDTGVKADDEEKK